MKTEGDEINLLQQGDYIKAWETDKNLALAFRMPQARSKRPEVSDVERTFYFEDAHNVGYGELIDISVRLVATGDYVGLAYLTFRQRMNCRRSNVVEGADLSFVIDLWDVKKFYIRNIYLGQWNRICGDHLVELRERFSWSPGDIHPVQNADDAVVTLTKKVRVHKC
jgi:hypothetical protein